MRLIWPILNKEQSSPILFSNFNTLIHFGKNIIFGAVKEDGFLQCSEDPDIFTENSQLAIWSGSSL